MTDSRPCNAGPINALSSRATKPGLSVEPSARNDALEISEQTEI
jgi:hypothetical protein